MSVWTYTGDPASSDRDAVRFLIGDTIETAAIFQDEEIDWLVLQNGNIYFAAALAADAAAAQFAGAQSQGAVKTKTVGALSISYDDSARASEFRQLARDLRFRGAVNSTIITYSGGISKSDKQTREQDTDWDKPSFARGMHDNPNAGNQDPKLSQST